MNESNSIKAMNKTNLTEQTKFRLDVISNIENCFYEEINQRKSCSKKLSKYFVAFGYIDKMLIVFSATSGAVTIISFKSAVGTPIGRASASFILIFSLTTGIVKTLQSITRNKRKSIIRWLYKTSIALKHYYHNH